MSRRTLRRLLAVLLIIVVGVVGYKLVGQDLKQRFLAPSKPEKEETYLYQKSLEGQLEEKIGQVLKQVYGKNAYFVSVVVKLHQKDEFTEMKRILPKTVSANFIERTTYEATVSKNALMSSEQVTHPDRLMPRNVAANTDNEDGPTISQLMPGLISEFGASVGYATPLPGFPVISTRSFVEDDDLYSQDEDAAALALQDESDSFMGEDGLLELEKNILTNEKRDDHLFFDEVFAETSTPNTIIDRLFVSVVVDKKEFENRGVSQEALQSLIENMAGIHLERGDQVVISVMPMRQAWLNIMTAYNAYKPITDKILGLLAKLKWPLYIAILLAAGWYLNKFVRIQLAKREEKKHAQHLADLKQKAEETAVEKQTLKSEDEAREDAILALAKEKPADFAELLLNWAEKES